MDQRDVCLFMLGVTGQSKVKKTESLIDVSAFPEHQLHLHNNYQTCPRERKAYVGHWQLCVIIRVPAHRRLDVTAMKMFWRKRSRTIEKRITFGVELARALGLVCYVDPSRVEASNREPIQQHGTDCNTIKGPPVCKLNETICFTTGSTTANELASGAEQRSGFDVTEFGDAGGSIDWERLAHLVLDDPGAPLDASLQTIQANCLELMLHSADANQRAVGQQTIERLRPNTHGPVSRVNTGYAPFEELARAVKNTCVDETGEIDNTLLYEHGDECYTNANEYMTRSLRRLRLHRVQRCVCGAKGTLTRRIRVMKPDGTAGRLALLCSDCGRCNVSSLLMTPDLGALKQRIGVDGASEEDRAEVLKLYDSSCDIDNVASELVEPVVPNERPVISIDAALTRALGRKRKRTSSERL